MISVFDIVNAILLLKTEVARKEGTSYFPENEYFVPHDMHTYVCVTGGKKCSFFRKTWPALFSCYLRFGSRPFSYYRRLDKIVSLTAHAKINDMHLRNIEKILKFKTDPRKIMKN